MLTSMYPVERTGFREKEKQGWRETHANWIRGRGELSGNVGRDSRWMMFVQCVEAGRRHRDQAGCILSPRWRRRDWTGVLLAFVFLSSPLFDLRAPTPSVSSIYLGTRKTRGGETQRRESGQQDPGRYGYGNVGRTASWCIRKFARQLGGWAAAEQGMRAKSKG
ncbi:uncharacterized protein LY79DRAFT_280917 [Colletotrichum navitas]|uniref:Uncharacterized protein n=1 Tax=Colletotrichum navitas TaxID=681940 RepID=A0AAD8V3J5_9PEZI|nr:uncharacterized protein LY79DRAFT_280917 [Colletotrichum navitas]KAK1584965.1 hypothetical protein LY79DRAFT_280917 [Colletotrichum navitas]